MRYVHVHHLPIAFLSPRLILFLLSSLLFPPSTTDIFYSFYTTHNMPAPNSQSITLSAVYSSPDSTRSFEHPLSSSIPSGSQDHTNAKVAYLADLKEQVPKLQNDINVFLTARMEEDKKSAEVSEKEKKEEENYGEENVEES